MFPKSFKIGKVIDIQNILKNHLSKHYGNNALILFRS